MNINYISNKLKEGMSTADCRLSHKAIRQTRVRNNTRARFNNHPKDVPLGPLFVNTRKYRGALDLMRISTTFEDLNVVSEYLEHLCDEAPEGSDAALAYLYQKIQDKRLKMMVDLP
jgi:hypothetical protein